MSPFVMRQKLKVQVLVLPGREDRPPPPPSPSICHELLQDEERHQGQNNRIETVVPVGIALAVAPAAPAMADTAAVKVFTVV